MDSPAAPATNWTGQAGPLLARLGFALDHTSPGLPPGGADLFVALRDRPLLEHVDAERIKYWAPDAGRGRTIHLDRGSLGRAGGSTEARPFLWGPIAIHERLPVAHRFLSFGGTVEMAPLDGATAVVRFRSPAPILRWTVNGGPADPLIEQVGAFLARLRIPIDFVPGVEERVSRTDPLALYAAYVMDVRSRLYHMPGTSGEAPAIVAWARSEAARLEREAPAAWAAGRGLLQDLGLSERWA